MFGRTGVIVLALGAALALASCGSDTPGGSGGDGKVGTGDGDGIVGDGTGTDGLDGGVGDVGDGSGADVPQLPDACQPIEINCNDLCGPITDNCTGKTSQCGSCGDDLVCDLGSHKCVPVVGTCNELGAQCGAIKNSCGIRLECGDCPAGQECDPDSNTCVKCTETTCIDLGYECGKAWLGCGPKNVMIDCGSECGAGKVCNVFYKVCESVCTPAPKDQVCAAAAAARGVECGTISDGCGGIVDCGGCPPGKACGVRGVANRCETPEPWPECVAAGRECGELVSKCGGIKLDCGDCPEGEVCNPNGICGPPCTPKTCAADFAGQCGSQLDDACNGTLDCKCQSWQVCSTGTPGQTGSCVDLKTCASYSAEGTPGQVCSNDPSPQFPRGDGKNLTCPCGAGGTCVASFKVVQGGLAGTCCVNTGKCDASSGCSVNNTCTNEPISCCKATEYCDGGANKCVAKKTCSDYTDGQNGSPCSTKKITAFDDGTGTGLQCSCVGGGACIDANPADELPGTCCVNQNLCDGSSCTVVNSCTGETVSCCGPGQYCDTLTNTCKDKKTCDEYTDGQSGSPCSTAPFYDDGAGGLLTCGCASGGVCVGFDAATDTAGSCCFNTAACNGTSCKVTNTCTGAAINCCKATEYCDTSVDKCVAKDSCATFGANGQLGDPCSDGASAAFPAGGGTNLTCKCSTASGKANAQCVGWSASAAGTCQCTPTVCDCSLSGQSDGCGAILSCACPANQVCFNKACCAPYACPPGNAGDECNVPHSSCGTTISCKCTGPAYNTCGGGGVANVCGCTPDTCRGRVGVFDDNCGGTISCNG